MTQVERTMLRPEGEVAGSLTEARKLSATRTELRSLLERLRCLNYAAHSARTHASADKAGRLLAWLIRRDCDRGPIVEIRSRAGGWCIRPGKYMLSSRGTMGHCMLWVRLLRRVSVKTSSLV
ncbi:hypothetical protein NDU88_003203 [Pleurodeles waltl]|uniref:Uncharacterized protein n=1 Tax=Pleurodeles waltl TaxID=8319 RepID=A0AAV7PAK3_PLEWA|nr:hypothetical protein NDU88_003203 [Pleurodeles waltl]